MLWLWYDDPWCIRIQCKTNNRSHIVGEPGSAPSRGGLPLLLIRNGKLYDQLMSLNWISLVSKKPIVREKSSWYWLMMFELIMASEWWLPMVMVEWLMSNHDQRYCTSNYEPLITIIWLLSSTTSIAFSSHQLCLMNVQLLNIPISWWMCAHWTVANYEVQWWLRTVEDSS